MELTPATSPHFSVLCIDDEPANLVVRKMLLESVGISTLTASSGKEGLDIFASHPVDAVIVDYSMPEMDGGVVAARLKEQKPEIPIIMLSAYTGAQENVDGVVDAFVEKGGATADLLRRLQSLLKIRSHTHPQLSGDYIVFLDSSRRYLDCSEAACRLLGYSRAEFVGLTVEDISYNMEDPISTMQRFLSKGTLQGEYVFRHKSGRPVLVNYRAWVFSDGCIAAVWSPVTDWQELYRSALLELDRKKLKSRIELALLAIHQNLRQLGASHPASSPEKMALTDALKGLRVLQRE